MNGLQIAVLGQPEVWQGGNRVAFRTRKALALLAYLAVEGRPQTRDTLAVFFWPESDAAKGKTMLRTSLAHVRQAVDEALLADGNTLQINPQFEYTLDLQALNIPSGPNRLPALEAAVDTYRGDFLAGFTLADAPEFDTWASQQRELWHRRFSQVLDQLSQLQSEGGSLTQAIATATRWTQHDPLNEAAYQRLMQLHFANGDRAAALSAFELARQTLARELAVELSPETLALAQRLQRQTLGPTRPAQPEPTASAGLGLLPMVGRVKELADLIAQSYSARRGSTRLVSVEGEGGIGKTRLATEFLQWATADGYDAWQGRAFETGGHLPYQPIVAALRQCIERENAPDDLVGDVWLAELSRLLPELRERYPDLPAPQPMDEAEAQSRLFEAVARWGLASAKRRPILFFIDDVQWADSASLDLLAYALRRWAEESAPVLVVLTLRSESRAALAGWLAGFNRTLPVGRLTLNTLTADHTQQLVQALPHVAGTPALAQFGEWLFEETDGQPFFVTELLKSLVEQGQLETSLATGTGPAALPSSVRELVSMRLTRLTPTASDLLTAGAVLGQTAEFETLCQVANVSENEGLRGLDELLAARLLAETPIGGLGEAAKYVFAHDKIRDVIYAEAGEARRRVFHRRALAVLEHEAAPPATLAHHALAGGLGDRAYTLHIAAGDAALGVFAVAEAIRYYGTAEQWLSTTTQSVPVEGQHQLYRQLGRAHELNTDRPAALAVYERMLTAAQRLGDGAMETTALNRLATLASQEPDYDRALTLLHRAQTVAEASGDRLGLVEAEWALAQLGIYQLDCEAAFRYGQRALALARETGERELIARCLNVVTFAEKGLAKVDTLFDHGREAVALYTSLGNRAMQADSLMLVADSRILHGELALGLAESQESLTLCEQIGNKWGQGNCLFHIAQGLSDLGRYSEALGAAQLALDVSRNAPYVPMFAAGVLGAIQRSVLNLEQAYATHTALMAEVVALKYPPDFVAMVAAELCADCVALGSWDEALTFAQQAAAHRNYVVLPLGHDAWPEALALIKGGMLTLAEQDVEWYGTALGAFRRRQVTYLRAKGYVAQGHGQLDEAHIHWQAALTLAQTIGLVEEQWQLQVLLGHTAEALELLRLVVANLTDPTLRETFLANLALHYNLHLDLA